MAMHRVRAVISSLAAGILITVGGCAEQSPVIGSGPEAADKYQRVELGSPAGGASFDLVGTPRAEKVIGTEGGTLEIPGGHTLTFPAGALSQPTTIRARVDTRYVEVDLDPHGIQFPAGRGPALTLSYAGTNANAFASLVTLYVGNSGQVEEVLNVENDKVAQKATVRLRHFSRYVLAGN